MSDLHGFLQDNTYGNNHVGDLCYHHHFIDETEAQKD